MAVDEEEYEVLGALPRDEQSQDTSEYTPPTPYDPHRMLTSRTKSITEGEYEARFFISNYPPIVGYAGPSPRTDQPNRIIFRIETKNHGGISYTIGRNMSLEGAAAIKEALKCKREERWDQDIEVEETANIVRDDEEISSPSNSTGLAPTIATMGSSSLGPEGLPDLAPVEDSMLMPILGHRMRRNSIIDFIDYTEGIRSTIYKFGRIAITMLLEHLEEADSSRNEVEVLLSKGDYDVLCNVLIKQLRLMLLASKDSDLIFKQSRLISYLVGQVDLLQSKRHEMQSEIADLRGAFEMACSSLTPSQLQHLWAVMAINQTNI